MGICKANRNRVSAIWLLLSFIMNDRWDSGIIVILFNHAQLCNMLANHADQHDIVDQSVSQHLVWFASALRLRCLKKHSKETLFLFST